NILLGWSCAQILDAAGYEVIKVQIVNDRGIAICKSMLAWQLYGENSTPASTGIKGDHFVGNYYVEFESRFRAEYAAWQSTDAAIAVYESNKKEDQSEAEFFNAFKNQYFNDYSALGQAAKAMLLQWEAGDPETVALWKRMNGWVYEGFNETYKALGVTFDKLYYESDTYLLGKDIIEKGLKTGVFYQKPDNSIWIDLEEAKLDHKLVLRSDGTSVYMTQDIGTATMRYEEFGFDKMVYVVADEQNYHFQVLFEIMKRLGAPYADNMHHLSYGMVELPTGKMKSREGTVVDADDLIAEVIGEARKAAEERGAVEQAEDPEQQAILRKIGLAALKFFIVKVQPKKWMTFDPKESVDLQGHTGPYIQYSYVRVNKVCQRAADEGIDLSSYQQYAQLFLFEIRLSQKSTHFP
ncbi:MAG: arginine--tRNA ligase, partial [Phaeodactylibacter sp.]|nr:arginine--tRNA ligase [Phaeodactylibacter sp.]